MIADPVVEIKTRVMEDRQVVGTPSQELPLAVIISNFNMPEAADALVNYLDKWTGWPFDLFLVDNGSDKQPPAKWTTIQIDKNVQTTNGWLVGVSAAHMTGNQYLAYCFLITSAEFQYNSGDVLGTMAQFLKDTPNAVGIHPALTKDSTTAWAHLKAKADRTAPRQVKMIDNICSMWRADFFDAHPFDPALIYGWGPDLEMSYLARQAGKSLWVDERVWVKKTTDIGYTMGRMGMKAEQRRQLARTNMNTVMARKYGSEWKKIMYLDNWE